MDALPSVNIWLGLKKPVDNFIYWLVFGAGRGFEPLGTIGNTGGRSSKQ